jgi:hypothetical protein
MHRLASLSLNRQQILLLHRILRQPMIGLIFSIFVFFDSIQYFDFDLYLYFVVVCMLCGLLKSVFCLNEL